MTRSTIIWEGAPMASRPATRDDLDVVTEGLTLAFVHDRVWSGDLARPDGSTNHHAAFWKLYVEGSLRYSMVFMTQDGSAVSVWIPPGGTELSDAGEEAVERLVEATLEPAAVHAISQLWERFDANHPRAEPHAYLSLLTDRKSTRLNSSH